MAMLALGAQGERGPRRRRRQGNQLGATGTGHHIKSWITAWGFARRVPLAAGYCQSRFLGPSHTVYLPAAVSKIARVAAWQSMTDDIEVT